MEKILLTKLIAENNKDIKHSRTPQDLFAVYDKYFKNQKAEPEDVYYFLIKTSYFIKIGQLKVSADQFLEKRTEIAESIDKIILEKPDFWQEDQEKKLATLIGVLVNLKIENASIEKKLLKVMNCLPENFWAELLSLMNQYLPRNNQNNQNKFLRLLKESAIKKIKEQGISKSSDSFLQALIFLINNNYYDRQFLSAEQLKNKLQEMTGFEFNLLTKTLFFNRAAQKYFFVEQLWQYVNDNFDKMTQSLLLNSAYHVLVITHSLKIKTPPMKWFPWLKLETQNILGAKRFPAEELVYFARTMNALKIDNNDFFIKLKNILDTCPTKFNITEKVVLLEVFDRKNLFVEELSASLAGELIAKMDALKMRSLATIASVYFKGFSAGGNADIFRAIIKRTLFLIEQAESSKEGQVNIRDATVIFNSCCRSGCFKKLELEQFALFFMKNSTQANIKDIAYILSSFTMVTPKQYEAMFTVFLSEIHDKKAAFFKNYRFNKHTYYRNIHDVLCGYTYIDKKYFVASDRQKLDEIFDYFRDNILQQGLIGSSAKDRLELLGDYLRFGRPADQELCANLFALIMENNDLESYDFVDLALFVELLAISGQTDFKTYQTVKTKLLAQKEPLTAMSIIKFLRYFLTIPKKDNEVFMFLKGQIKQLDRISADYFAAWLIYYLAMAGEKDNTICKMIADSVLTLVNNGEKINFSYQLMIAWSLVILKFYHKEYFYFLRNLINESLLQIDLSAAGKINTMYLEMKNLALQDDDWQQLGISEGALEIVRALLWQEEREINKDELANNWQAEVIKLINNNMNNYYFNEVFDRDTSLSFIGDQQQKIVLDADTFFVDNMNYLSGKKDIKHRILNGHGWEIISLNKKKWSNESEENILKFINKKLKQIEEKKLFLTTSK